MFDKFKDVIARLSFAKANKNETVKYSGGISYYNGGYQPANGKRYEVKNDTFALATTTSTKAKREHYGVDAQVSFESPAGLTTLRGEYIAGKLSGNAASSYPYNPYNYTAAPSGDTYFRNFDGAYFYLVHAIAKTKLSVVAKYDWYNPNKDVNQSTIGGKGTVAANKTTAADIAYNTLGLGLIFRWDANVKFTAYYDKVTNKSTALTGYKSDIKDDVFTFRVQYKF